MVILLEIIKKFIQKHVHAKQKKISTTILKMGVDNDQQIWGEDIFPRIKKKTIIKIGIMQYKYVIKIIMYDKIK